MRDLFVALGPVLRILITAFLVWAFAISALMAICS